MALNLRRGRSLPSLRRYLADTNSVKGLCVFAARDLDPESDSDNGFRSFGIEPIGP